jgi:hypothetical protein
MPGSRAMAQLLSTRYKAPRCKPLFLARCFLLRNRCASWSLTSSRVCVSTLASYGKRSTVSQPSIATNVHQTFDVHLDPLPEIALDITLRFEHGSYPAQLVFTQILYSGVDVDSSFLQYRAGSRTTDSVDIGESYFGSLVWWQIYASYTCHFISRYPCLCLCLGLMQITRTTPLR